MGDSFTFFVFLGIARTKLLILLVGKRAARKLFSVAVYRKSVSLIIRSCLEKLQNDKIVTLFKRTIFKAIL